MDVSKLCPVTAKRVLNVVQTKGVAVMVDAIHIEKIR